MRSAPGCSRRSRRWRRNCSSARHAALVPRPPRLDPLADPDFFLGQLLVEFGGLGGFNRQDRLFRAVKVSKSHTQSIRRPRSISMIRVASLRRKTRSCVTKTRVPP